MSMDSERATVEIKASKKYNEEFIKELGEAVRDIVEGRVKSYEEFLNHKLELPPKEWKINIRFNDDFTKVDIDIIEDYSYLTRYCDRKTILEILKNTIVSLFAVADMLGAQPAIEIGKDAFKIYIKVRDASPIAAHHMMIFEFATAPLVPILAQLEANQKIPEIIEKACKQKYTIANNDCDGDSQ